MTQLTARIRRAGNNLEVSPATSLLKVLDRRLQYLHKTAYRGQELRQRQAQKRANPGTDFNPYLSFSPRRLYRADGDRLFCPAGLRSRVITALDASHIPWTYEDLRQNRLPPAQWERLAEIPDLDLRYRQDEALATIDAAESGIIGAATGFGKGFIAKYLAVIYPLSTIVFITVGRDLLDSTYRKLLEVTPDVGRIGGGHYEPGHRITLVNIDSIHRVDLSKAQLIIGDEVHCMGTDKRAAALCSQYTDARWIGFSASFPSRLDGADAVVESIFGPKIFDLGYAEASAHGVVTPIRAWFVPVPDDRSIHHVDPQADPTTKRRWLYWRNDHRNQILAQAVATAPSVVGDRDPQILVMVETAEHAFRLRKYLPDFEIAYGGIRERIGDSLEAFGLMSEADKMTDERARDLLVRFERGDLKRVIATHKWRQGVDAPGLKVFVRADGGSSTGNNIQLPGRLARIHDDKDFALLIDTRDEFDPWAARRSTTREKDYKANGIQIITV